MIINIYDISDVCVHMWWYIFIYDTFHYKCYTPEIRQIEKLRFHGISWYTFNLRFWFNLNLSSGIWVFGFGRFWVCSIFSGTCRTTFALQIYRMCACKCAREWGWERVAAATHMNEKAWHEWVVAHIWTSHVTRMNESWYT